MRRSLLQESKSNTLKGGFAAVILVLVSICHIFVELRVKILTFTSFKISLMASTSVANAGFTTFKNNSSLSQRNPVNNAKKWNQASE
mmetsp:Transcript_31878/g.48429  ORF Transcript_31878/g.48429 Transcript_31878/m.48429 type:complete len:87 (+) Transcript_31878:1285-1545(+)